MSCPLFSGRRAALATLLALVITPLGAARSVPARLHGTLRTWHRVTLTFTGPATDEQAEPNPFLDYRLEVTFTGPSGQVYEVPGFYAADGNAGDTGAEAGDQWRVHIAPDEAGDWTYRVSFRTGSEVAVDDDPHAGLSGGPLDGRTGRFAVLPSDKTGRDLRAQGRLDYVGKHHLRFAGSGRYFLKCGADAPENLLAYADFDGSFKDDGIKDNLVKTWSAHVRDWEPNDPTWAEGRGKGLIGAINYLASKGMNAFSFLTMNINGDDRNVFPYTDYTERRRLDVSRLAQWEVVFEHGTRRGMHLHFKTQETENELLLNGGDLGVERMLYYRELIARFGHHLALNWNLGEEVNNASTKQKKAWARYIWDHDPYHHPIVIHNGDNHYDLLGPDSAVTGFSLQTNRSDFSRVHAQTLNYLRRSDDAGKPWVVACDEPGDASHALVPDADDPAHDNARRNALWGNLMAGGAGLEFYFGYQHAQSDLTCQDWRSRDLFWDQCRHALTFFADVNIPFWDMTSADDLIESSDDYCLALTGVQYVIFLKHGGTTRIDLPAGDYSVEWYNPRAGGPLQIGTVERISGPGRLSVGRAPAETTQDWAVLITALASPGRSRR